MSGVGGGLHTLDHEHVFGRHLHLHAALLLELVHLVSDCVQVNQHLGLILTLTELGPRLLLVGQTFHISVGMATKSTGTNGAALLNKEFDAGYGERALGVVDVNHGLGSLLGRIDILLVVGPHLAGALVDAAPGGDLALLHLRFVLLELHWGLSNGHHLLKLHGVLLVDGVHGGLNVVLDLSLRALAHIGVLKVD